MVESNFVRFLLYRLEFQAGEDRRQPEEEFLEFFGVDNGISEIVNMTGIKYGGGAFRLDLKHMDTVLTSKPFEISGPRKPLPRPSLFKPVIDYWYDDTMDVFDQTQYNDFMTGFSKHGVEDFLDFLQASHCTYSSANKFLIECLHKAQDHGWDT